MARSPNMMASGVAAGLLTLLGGQGAWAQAQPAIAASPAQVLKRVVLLATPEASNPAGLPVEGAAVERDAALVLSQAQASAVLQPLIGRPMDSQTLSAARAAVSSAYAGIGRPFVGVFIPRQDVTNGVLQLVVLEARLGKLQVMGARWFPEDSYREAVRLRPGQPIDAPQLQAGIDRLNRNPYRKVTVVAAPGETIGTTDINLRVEDRRPFSVNAGLDNTGTDATGLYRGSLGFDWGDAFGRGDSLNYQFSGSVESAAVRQHALAYSAGLPRGHSLNLSASFARSRSDDDSIFSSTGDSIIAAVRYGLPLPRRGAIEQSLTLGFDYKDTDNDILFGGVSVFPSRSQVEQLVVDYSLQASRAGVTGGVTATLVASPGGWSAHNDDAAFNLQRAGADSRYAYARLSASGGLVLPRGAVWQTRLVGQVSDGPLLASEQLSLAGVNAVRGFIEQGAVRDHGVVWRNELRAPAKALGWPIDGGGSLSAYWFLDGAAGGNRRGLPGASGAWTSLAATGVGADLQLTPRSVFRISVGAPVLREGATGRTLAAQLGLQAAF
ncbi:ShlB/FhaC/HecB family hemolysin secretion/activation protein [Caulobacter sp.]|uniref:ShlB/FhaC/HecB family hemolysin secretion/activation protein n=1 Tax=Caulobacter sp. TaxID=78 RepID=UPI001B18D785|nr:ShlB/FhaC/HecB family hemolysin secretion/activation protein [Caulobacter sp.]MBO9547005.1 ShlB/FhaC/HecB family hemolysin secretion/activation protein [Caulobacter sp.]